MRTVVRKYKGFTLVELVMVVVILSILAAIAIPRMNMRPVAQRANCLASVEAIKSALGNYYSKRAIQGTAAFPDTLNSPAFISYLNGGKLPKHPINRAWDDYYTTQSNGAMYTFQSGKSSANGACTGF